MKKHTANKPTIEKSLAVLSRSLRMTSGTTSRRVHGDVTVLFQAIPGAGSEVDHLVTVHAGFPVPDAVVGLDFELCVDESDVVVERGKTDGRGQFRLEGLSDGVYRLKLTAPPSPGVIPMAGEVAPGAMGLAEFRPLADRLAAKAARLTESVWQTNGPVEWCQKIEMIDDLNRNVLEVRIKRADVPILRFRITRADDTLLAVGLLGLYQVVDDWYGETVLDFFCQGGLASEIEGFKVGDFEILTDLNSASPKDFKVAIGATSHGPCREALEWAAKQRTTVLESNWLHGGAARSNSGCRSLHSRNAARQPSTKLKKR